MPAVDPVESLNPLALARFYEDPGWAARFRGFDASYGVGSLDAAVRVALHALRAEAP